MTEVRYESKSFEELNIKIQEFVNWVLSIGINIEKTRINDLVELMKNLLLRNKPSDNLDPLISKKKSIKGVMDIYSLVLLFEYLKREMNLDLMKHKVKKYY